MKKIAVVGYGNLGRGVEIVAKRCADLTLEYIFTRRSVSAVSPCFEETKVCPYSEILNYKSDIDCLILAGGSQRDLPRQAPELAEHFNLVDSFDTHSDIGKHVQEVGTRSEIGGRLALLSIGWDPGLLSVIRLYLNAFMPFAAVNTFWGRGVSQGHSDAIRRINGVLHAIQYTVPISDSIAKARSGERITATEAHKRICYVVAEAGAETKIAESIKNMENYFSGYETEIRFISEREFFEHHTSLSHKGEIIASGESGINGEHKASADFSLQLDSNPEFTANVLVAAARAACKLYSVGERGAKTIFDIPPKYFLGESSISLL